MHDEAPSTEATDWPQILAPYELLQAASDNPVVALNHAVAAAMVHGPRAGLDLLAGLAADARLDTGHRFHAVRAQLLELAGEPEAARSVYLEAAQHTTSLPHQRYPTAGSDCVISQGRGQAPDGTRPVGRPCGWRCWTRSGRSRSGSSA